MGNYDLVRLVNDAQKALSMSPTNVRYKHNKRIYDKLKGVIDASDGIDEFHSAVLHDAELFCLTYIRMDNELPMYLSPWQSEFVALCEEHRQILGIMCRKMGKSAVLSAYVVWRMCKVAGENVIVFAPTEKQLVLMKDIVKNIGRSSYLMEEYVQPKGDVGKKGNFGKEEIVFGRNASKVMASNLAQTTGAATKKGFKGSLFIVDEIGLVQRDVQLEVVDPMMADAYTQKKMIKIGTPSLSINPELRSDWAVAQLSSTTGTYHVDMWDGIEQGCVTREYIKNTAASMNIPCQWMAIEGRCGKRDFDKNTLIDGWACDDCCLQSAIFVQECLGEFSDLGDRFFPGPALQRCSQDSNGNPTTWPLKMEFTTGKRYVIGIDYGLVLNNTQITVFEVSGDTATLAYWEEMTPYTEALTDGLKSYDPILRRIKEIYNAFSPHVWRIFPDSTSSGMQTTMRLTKDEGDGYGSIPQSRFYCNEPAAKKGLLGVILSGRYKHYMMDNYRRAIIERRVKLPRSEPFWTKFIKEHEGIIASKVPGQVNDYLKFKEPPGGSIDLVDSMALACLSISKEVRYEPWMGLHRG